MRLLNLIVHWCQIRKAIPKTVPSLIQNTMNCFSMKRSRRPVTTVSYLSKYLQLGPISLLSVRRCSSEHFSDALWEPVENTLAYQISSPARINQEFKQYLLWNEIAGTVWISPSAETLLADWRAPSIEQPWQLSSSRVRFSLDPLE